MYGDDDAMKKLVVEYKSLSSADSAAFEAVKEASELVKADGLTYEQRVKQFGEEEARRHGKPHTDAVETRRLTLKALNKFRDEHPLIAAIVDGTTCRA
ncbi:hypothetical protein ACQHIH_21350 (plasmid) [Xanthomonas sontii]|uniref:hypothetical protein n=1 Tax=Xanthomonas sontii TaxID=2650745 RepID=UPI003F86DF5A